MDDQRAKDRMFKKKLYLKRRGSNDTNLMLCDK